MKAQNYKSSLCISQPPPANQSTNTTKYRILEIHFLQILSFFNFLFSTYKISQSFAFLFESHEVN